MTDIVERLRDLARSDFPNDPESLREAADTIVRLRGMVENLMAVAGKAERGPSFAEITEDLPRQPKPAQRTLEGV